MKHAKKLFLSLIAILAIFTIVSCGGNELPEPDNSDSTEILKSDNLDAWRKVCEANPTVPDDGITIDIQVKGTVTNIACDKKKETYISDGLNGALKIYGADPHDIKVGEELTLKISLLDTFDNIYQTNWKHVEIIDRKDVTPIEPKLIHDVNEFGDMGTGINIDYVTMFARVIDSTVFPYKIAILSEETFTTETNAEKIPPIDKNLETVPVFSITDAVSNLSTGDYCKISGQMTNYKGTVQLYGYTVSNLKAAPATPHIPGTFANYIDIAKLGEAKSFTQKDAEGKDIKTGYEIKGIVVLNDSFNLVIANPEENAEGKHDIIWYSGANAQGDIAVGTEVTVNTVNTALYKTNAKHTIQCSDFNILKKGKIANPDILTTLATSYTPTSNDNLKELVLASDPNIGINENIGIVKVKETVTKVVTANGKITGIHAKADPKESWDNYFKNLSLPEDEYAVNDTIYVYGIIIRDKNGNPFMRCIDFSKN